MEVEKMLSPIFEKFVEKSPISVMARDMMERVLNPNQLDQWFNETAAHRGGTNRHGLLGSGKSSA
jgi:hypothetical protein